MPVKNFVSWNAMITVYIHTSRYDEALRTFQQMMIQEGFMPDEATLASVVSACAQDSTYVEIPKEMLYAQSLQRVKYVEGISIMSSEG
jgi:pentatricopeptide repeat protein